MKLLAAFLMALMLSPAFAQYGGRHGQGQGYGRNGGGYGQGPGQVQGQRGYQGPRDYRHDPRNQQYQQRPMPPPERRMAWEDRERLREQVRSGQMSRDEARQRWREQRGADPGQPGRYSQEQREQLRRDVLDYNRDMQRR